MNKPRLLDLFSGIGGFSIAFETEGFETIGFCEYEEIKRIVLRHWYPFVPILPNIRDTESLRQFRDKSATLNAFRVAYHANLLRLSDKCAVIRTNDGFGQKPSNASASFDPATQSLRTHQLSLLLMEDAPTTELFHDWSRSGMICSGMYFPLRPLVQDISETESCLSLPTPWASANENRQTKLTPSQMEGTHGLSLNAVVHNILLPTPLARDYKDTPGCTPNRIRRERSEEMKEDTLPRRIYEGVSTETIGGMKLTPEFLCWLQGFPLNWLSPITYALGIVSSRKSSKSSPEPSIK